MLVEVDPPCRLSPVQSSGNIGRDIRALRRSRNWTLNDLAEQLGRSVGCHRLNATSLNQRLKISAKSLRYLICLLGFSSPHRPIRTSRIILFGLGLAG